MPDTHDRLDDLELRVSRIEQDVTQLKRTVGLEIDPNEWVPVRVAATQIGVHRSTLNRWGVVVPGKGVLRTIVEQRQVERRTQPSTPTTDQADT